MGMDHLMFLGMADNGLSNASIRKLNVSARMTGRGSRRLRHLDLTCNYTTDRNSLHFLNKTFRHMDNLNLARRAVPVREVNPPVIHGISKQAPADLPERPRPARIQEPVPAPIPTPAPMRRPRKPIPEDGGWVKPMVNVWDDHTRQLEEYQARSPQPSPIPDARSRSPRPRSPRPAQEETRGWVSPMVDNYQSGDPEDARKFEERTLTLYFRRPPPDVAVDSATGKFLPKREYNEIVANEARGIAAETRRRVEFQDQGAPLADGTRGSYTSTTTTTTGGRSAPRTTLLPEIWSN